MWHLPRPGLEPVSPALAGRFSTTAPPGKPLSFFCCCFSWVFLLRFNFLIIIFYFNNFIYLFIFFLSYCLHFLLCCVAERVLVLWPGIRPVPLKWESRVQDIGPPQSSWLHVISNNKSSPRDLHLNAKTQLHSMSSKLQCWTLCQTTSKTRTQTHPLAERLPKIIIRPQTPQNTPPDVDMPTRKTRSSLIHQNTGTSPLHQEAYTTH